MERLRDGTLIRQYVEDRSQAAFAELGRRYANLVFSVCLRELQDRTLAEDAAQVVFLLLAQKAASLRKENTLSGWLFTTSRLVSQNLRKQERRRKAREEKAGQEMPPQLPIENVEWLAIEPHLNEALSRLDPASREAVLLRFLGEYSLNEIGEYLGVSANTARMRVTRALEKLRAHLTKAGVTVSVSALALLLQERSCNAAPEGVMQAVQRLAADPASSDRNSGLQLLAQQTRRAMSFATLKVVAFWLVLILTGSALSGIVMLRERVSPETRRAVLASLVGTWQGKLEFQDDQNGQRYTYPTTLRIQSLGNGDTIEGTIGYEGDSGSDRWQATIDLRSGLFRLTEDPGRSQNQQTILEGSGDFSSGRVTRLELEGTRPFVRWDVRKTIMLNGDSLTFQEDIRRGGQAFRFRNQYSLRRVR